MRAGLACVGAGRHGIALWMPDATAALRPYFPAIDGLRAIAVFSVVTYHLWAPLLPGGFTGVDIFFVISGFVVSLSVPQGGVTRLRPLLVLFYSRRAVRILPALYACLLSTTLLCVLFVPRAWLSSLTERSAAAAVFGLSNVTLAGGDGGYFDPRADYNPFIHTWSLGVEEQFYLIFPWFFIFFLAGRRRLSIAVFCTSFALSIGIASHWAGGNQVRGFYLIFSRFWELAAGVLAFQLGVLPGASRRLPAAVFLPLLSWVCLGVIGFSLCYNRADRTPFPASLAPCAATAVLLMLIRAGRVHPFLARALTQPPMRYLGRISYSLYLWHWPVFSLFRWTCGLAGPVAFVVAPALALAAAAGSYRYVETPPRRALAKRQLSPGIVLVVGLLAVGATAGIERNLWPLRSVLSFSSVNRHKADWYTDEAVRSPTVKRCRVEGEPDKSLGIPVFSFRRHGCAPIVTSAPNLFVVGDSHSGAYQTLIEMYAMDSGGVGRMYVQGGCAVLGVLPADPSICNRFIANALADLHARAKPGDIVFLPGLRIHRISDQFIFLGEAFARTAMRDEAPWRAENLAATIPMIDALLKSGVRVIFEAPKPEFNSPTFRCVDWFSAPNPICAGGSTIDRAIIEDLRAPVMAQLRDLKRALPAIRIWDPLPILCPGAVCSAYENGKPLFFDGDHLSAYGNRKLSPFFSVFLGERG